MLAWSPILVQQIEIHALGFVLRQLQLNRHRETEVALHVHAHAQLILYLGGEGVQNIRRRRRVARAGDLFVLPAGTLHGFALRGRSRPLCLVLDYEVADAGRVRSCHRVLPPAKLNELHALLARVPPKGRLTLSDYPVVLAVVALLLDQTPAAPAAERAPRVFEKIREVLRTSTPLTTVARAAGYHPDHLNRKLKRETGLGLRAMRNQLRLEAAQHALRTEPTVAEAATRVGFEDPNYFARWFRQQTGWTPSEWLSRQK